MWVFLLGFHINEWYPIYHDHVFENWVIYFSPLWVLLKSNFHEHIKSNYTLIHQKFPRVAVRTSLVLNEDKVIEAVPNMIIESQTSIQKLHYKKQSMWHSSSCWWYNLTATVIDYWRWHIRYFSWYNTVSLFYLLRPATSFQIYQWTIIVWSFRVWMCVHVTKWKSYIQVSCTDIQTLFLHFL